MSLPKPKIKKTKGPNKKTKQKSRLSPPPDDDLPNLKYYDDMVDIEEPVTQPATVTINFDMIVRRNLPEPMKELNPEDVVAALHAVSHIRLDRENISHIDNLEMLGTKVTNLYLQQNRIQEIENLESLINLEFLTLSGNRIESIKNLTFADDLKFLDLSDNCIEDIEFDELPKSLKILSLKGNPCAEKDRYRESLFAALPNLLLLDGSSEDDVMEPESDEESDGVEGDPDVEDIHYPHRSVDEYITSASVRQDDVFQDIADKLRHRSEQRIKEVEKLHENRQKILEELRKEQT